MRRWRGPGSPGCALASGRRPHRLLDRIRTFAAKPRTALALLAVAILLVSFAAPSGAFDATSTVTLHLKRRDGGVTTFVVPRAYVRSPTPRAGSTVDEIALAFAYPSLKPTGAPGTANDRSVVLVYFREAYEHFDMAKTIARNLREWIKLDSSYHGLERYIAPVELAKMKSGSVYFDDHYLSAEDHSFLVRCLNKRGISAACDSQEGASDRLELTIIFPARELGHFENLRREIRQRSLSFISNRT
jgi:hypothetical protein